MAFKAPYLPYDRIREEAEAFFTRYHPNRTIPVPIDLIVERDFGMDIITLPGLQENFDTVAFISRDLTAIYVDEHVFQSRENRYRFSIAHELGHRILHSETFGQLDFRDIESWKQVATNIPEREYGLLEFHASSFAGLVLVPELELRNTFLAAANRAKEAGFNLTDAGTGVRDTIEGYVARGFVVSQAVVHRRVEFDGLWNEVT